MRKRTQHARVIAHRPGGKMSDAGWRDTTDDIASRAQIAKECGPVIYAIKLRDGMVKIGHTTDIANRVHAYDCGFDGLLALKPGTLQDEQAIHATLVAHRAMGREYYHPTPEVLAVVNDLRATFGFEPIAA